MQCGQQLLATDRLWRNYISDGVSNVPMNKAVFSQQLDL